MPLTGSQHGPSESCCLVLMLKAPARSKRRLGPLGAEAAEHLIACAFEDLAAWPGPVCYAPAGADDAAWLARRVPAAPLVIEQRGATLGERIEHVAAGLGAAGHARHLVIGIDCPELGLPYLTRAAAALEQADAVLGPATDGGVVVMGTRRAWPPLGGLPWSTSAVHAALVAALHAGGASVVTLPPRADVDSLDDLAALGERLAADSRPARRALSTWLTSNGPRLRIGT